MRLVQYPDVTSIKQKEEIRLADGVMLEVQDLPPNYGDDLEAKLPPPVPPSLGPLRENGRVAMGTDGRPIVKYNENDPAYKKACAEHRTLQTVYFLTEGVCDGQLEFDAELEGEDYPAYYRAVLGELIAFGWGIGQVTHVADTVRKLSNISEAEIEKAVQGFSHPDAG